MLKKVSRSTRGLAWAMEQKKTKIGFLKGGGGSIFWRNQNKEAQTIWGLKMQPVRRSKIESMKVAYRGFLIKGGLPGRGSTQKKGKENKNQIKILQTRQIGLRIE